jgi:GNAT superfamily N-acetyltransferase
MLAGGSTTDDPMIQIRPAGLAEIERVRDIERRSASRFLGTELAWLADDDPTDALTLSDRIAQGALLVAAEASEPVAFVMFREVEACAYVEQIDVLPTHAGRAIGAALLDAVAATARERGLAALTLSTFRDVPFNAPYYRRLGFLEVPVLTPAMRRIRQEHEARGLDETARLFMRRDV